MSTYDVNIGPFQRKDLSSIYGVNIGPFQGGPPVIDDQSTSLTVYVEDSVSLFVEASGSEPLTYQWYKDGILLSGEISDTLQFTAYLVLSGVYYCIVSNPIGSIQSDDILLYVSPDHYPFTDCIVGIDLQVTDLLVNATVIDKVVV